MHVYVTGIAGFLGSWIASACIEAGHKVSGIDDLSGGEESNVPERVSSWQDGCCEHLHTIEADVVFHCAALPHEGLSVFSPMRITESIFRASVAVFTAAVRGGVKRVIYCSSMSRYGSGGVPFLEMFRPQPQDPYAIAKVAAEDVLRVMAKVHGFEYMIAVPHNVVGPRQRYYDPFRNVAAIMANRMLLGKPAIIYGDGLQKRCFSDVRDVTAAMMRMIDCPSGEVINVGPDEGVITILELESMLSRITKNEHPPIHVPDRPQEVKHAWCSADKARRLLDYECRFPLETTLTDLVAWMKPRPFEYHLGIELPGAPETWTKRLM